MNKRWLLTMALLNACCTSLSKDWFSPRKAFSSLGIVLVFGFACIASPALAQNRYTTGKINSQADGFYSRFNRPLINVDFIVTSVRGSVNHRVNQALDGAKIEPTSAGSIIIESGVDIGDATIININDGDKDIIAIEK